MQLDSAFKKMLETPGASAALPPRILVAFAPSLPLGPWRWTLGGPGPPCPLLPGSPCPPLQVPCRPLDAPSLSGTGRALRQPLGSGPVSVFGPQVVGTGPFWHRSVGVSRSMGRPPQASSFLVYCLLRSCNSLPSSFQCFLKPADCGGWDEMGCPGPIQQPVTASSAMGEVPEWLLFSF